MYNIQSTIPKHITIKPKENIESLTDEVISACYRLSIKDYLQLNLSINGVIDTINLINHYSSLDFSSTSSLVSGNDYYIGINDLISSYFVCITSLNGHPIVYTELNEDEELVTIDNRKINTLNKFIVNNIVYTMNNLNKGNIELPDRYISGRPLLFVNSFNDQTGNVSGAILLIIYNNNKTLMVNGVVTLTGLTVKNGYVIRVNNDIRNLYLMTAIKYNDNANDILTATATNSGAAEIPSTYFYQNIKDNEITSTLTLSNVNESDDTTAITKLYLTNYLNDKKIILTGTINGITLTLELNWYPLHFYDSDGNWLPNVSWTKNGNDYNLNESVNGIYSAMKVTEDE